MDYLQYFMTTIAERARLYDVLNLIINGLPSILPGSKEFGRSYAKF